MSAHKRWEQFDSVAALVVVLDRAGRIVSFNPACEKLTGYRSSEVLGTAFWDVVVLREEVDAMRAMFEQIDASSFPNEYQSYWRTKSGERRWIAWSNTARLDKHGDVEIIIATGVDLTATKQTDDALRESEERFRVLVDRVPDYAIFMLDPEGRFVSWNEGARRITGYTAEEVLGRDYEMLYPGDDRAAGKPRANLAAALEQDHIEEVGWRIRKDETVFFAEVSITALHAADGTLRGFAKVIRDATPYWKIEQREYLFDQVSDVLAHALPDYDETLQAVARIAVHSFADVCTIGLYDEETRTTKRVVTVCSDPAVEVVADRIRALPHDRTQVTIMSRVLETKTAELHTLESYLDAPDLQPDYVEVIRALAPRSIIVAPIVSRGRSLGIISVVRTQRVAFDEDDLHVAEELGERAGIHIDNARLYRHAQQAVLTRDDMMNIVAHDLRNPLNSIGIQAQLVLREISKGNSDLESLRESLTAIKTSVTTMNSLIRDLFDAARSEAGQLVRRIRPCEPARLVADAVQGARALAASKKLELSTETPPNLPLVNADSERVHQVLANLLGNAIKFTPAGGSILVSVAAQRGDVSFSVSDTGPGISGDDIPHVFDRFWKGKSADRRGAGLGLWICNGIVKSHGGALTVESRLGHGSTFRFTLPIASDEPPTSVRVVVG
jgi:PAS domain S-box-containing protein